MPTVRWCRAVPRSVQDAVSASSASADDPTHPLDARAACAVCWRHSAWATPACVKMPLDMP